MNQEHKLPSAQVSENEIVCPHCGHDSFSYLEDITCVRACEGMIDGVFHIDALYKTDGYDENGDNPRLSCNQCSREFAVPEQHEFT